MFMNDKKTLRQQRQKKDFVVVEMVAEDDIAINLWYNKFSYHKCIQVHIDLWRSSQACLTLIIDIIIINIYLSTLIWQYKFSKGF